jgi:hypothetical protein
MPAAAQPAILILHGRIGAQREIELKDGPKGPPAYGGAEGILDFNFSLRCGLACNIRKIPP